MIQRVGSTPNLRFAGTADYGSFTVYINYHTRPEPAFRRCLLIVFCRGQRSWSSVIKLHRKQTTWLDDEKLFFDIVHASFASASENLVNGLMPILGSKLSKEEINKTLINLGFDERVRGETLGICRFCQAY
jgi:16S rRNA (adenine1518-N6/adenine1519-N6)-dimethyltransferase